MRAAPVLQLIKDMLPNFYFQVAANEKVFAMAGYSLNVQPEQMRH